MMKANLLIFKIIGGNIIMVLDKVILKTNLVRESILSQVHALLILQSIVGENLLSSKTNLDQEHMR